MESFLLYIGKAALASGTFYLAYLALFQHQKHFLFNRIYLPVSLAISFLIPLITFTKIRYIQPVETTFSNSFAYLPEAAAMSEPQFTFEWFHYLLAIYLLGIFVFLINLLLGHLKAMNIIRFSRLKELFGAEVNLTKKDVHPFSFFKRIVLSEKTLENPNLKMIVDHEMVHVKERHTYDILFAEILFLFQWFNPFAWLIREAMRSNLEYLTDHQVTQKHNAEAYQLAMVGLAHKKGVAPFLTALNGSQLKNRIIMMKKKTENRYSLLKQLVVLPLLAILIMGLSNKEVRTEIVQNKKEVKIVVDGKEIPNNDPSLASIDFSKGFDGGEIVDALNLKEKVVSNFLYVDEGTDDLAYYIRTSDYVPGSNTNFDKITSDDEQSGVESYKAPKMLYAVDGKIIETTDAKIVGKQDYESASILSGDDAVAKYGEQVKDASVLDLKSGKPNVKVYSDQSLKELTVKGKVTNEKGEPLPGTAVLIKGTTTGTIADMEGNFELQVQAESESTLIFSMPGYQKKEVLYEEQPKVNVVLKADGSAKKDEIKAIGYGSQKDGSEPLEKAMIHIKGEQNEPIYYVDGIENKNIDWLSPDQIENISVLKGETLTALYGDKGKNGVVIVTTKFAPKEKLNEALMIVDGKIYDGDVDDFDPESIESIDVLKDASATKLYGPKAKNGAIIIKTKNAQKFDGKSPLVFIDGEKYTGDMDEVDPESIQSIDVLKDASAIENYGEEAKDGVILITTKTEGITSELDLRKHIAKNMKYPSELQESNVTGISKIYVKVSSNGGYVVLNDKAVENAIPVDEVVVVGYKPENVATTKVEGAQDKFDREAKRVIGLLPAPINIPGFKGETIVFTVKYMLQ